MTARLGLIARADDRGLGAQTHEIWRHLQPSVTVVVDMSPVDVRGQWPQHFDRYPGSIISPWAGYMNPLTPEAVDALLSCDVIFTVETIYQPDLFSKARAKGIRTVIYVNPELWRPHETDDASDVWLPTDWRKDELPEEAVVVPMPVAVDRFQTIEEGEGWLHVAGHQARGDRDGTRESLRAARGAGIHLNVTSQDRMGGGSYFTLRPSTEHYWEQYDQMGFMILPRRYGGLSLKAQEALTHGMVLVMSDVSPNRMWPIVPVHASNGQTVTLPGGRVRMAHVDMNHLIATLKTLRTDEDLVERQREAARRWTVDQTWTALLPEWRERLEC